MKIGGDKGGGSFKMSFQVTQSYLCMCLWSIFSIFLLYNADSQSRQTKLCKEDLCLLLLQGRRLQNKLHLALDTYKDQVSRLQSGTTWRYATPKHYTCLPALKHSLLLSTCRGKRIRVFLFGDYEFLCRILGISGPTGKY